MLNHGKESFVNHETEVIVVGGGPTGMTAAGDLARAGCSVAVLERWPTINPSSRAFATMARTLEVLDARGLADDLLELGVHAARVKIFGGARIDLTHLHSRYPFVLVTPQTHVDQALGGYAAAQGADIHRGLEVVGLTQDADGVTVVAQAKDDPTERSTWRAKYVIAADGAHSTVRTLLGVDYPGRRVLASMVLADVKLAHGPTDGLTVDTAPDVLGFLAPYNETDPDGAWYRAMVWDRNRQLPDADPVDDSEVVDVLERALKTDYGVLDIRWTSRFHSDERQVENYRHGRVFFAGDAAHRHSPMGGQGMNTGIQDAANLAWKLAAVLGGADAELLDTYQNERHPVGKRVLLQSGLMARGATLHARPAVFMRNLLAPKLLAVPWVRDAVAGSFAGTTLRYGRRELIGTRATEIPLAEARLTVLQRSGAPVLIRECGSVPVDAAIEQAERADDGPAVLVRPDGYIAWAGASTDRAEWASTLHKIAGTRSGTHL